MLKCFDADTAERRTLGASIKTMLCSFSFEGANYWILPPADLADEECICERVTWGPFSYFKTSGEPPDERVLSIANAILFCCETNANAYPMRGEHYIVTVTEVEGEEWVNVRRATKGFVTLAKRIVPRVIQTIVSVLFAAFCTWSSLSLVASWLLALFPNAEYTALKISVCVIEGGGALCILLLDRRWHSYFRRCIGMLIPLGVIMLLGMMRCYFLAAVIIPLTALFLTVLCSLVLSSLGTAGGSRIGRFFEGAFLSLFALTVTAFIAAGGFRLPAYVYTSSDNLTATCDDETLIIRYDEACGKLNETVWLTLSPQEKTDTLQAICDYECRMNLGCESVDIHVGLTGSLHTLGEYYDSTHSLTISLYHLEYDSVEEVLQTALHEIRHSYQYRAAKFYASIAPYVDQEYKDLYAIRLAEQFSYEVEHYVDGDTDYELYYNQAIEKDSRDWAAMRITETYRVYFGADQALS